MATVVLALALSTAPTESTVTCAMVRSFVRTVGREQAHEFARKYLTEAQAVKARRCLRSAPTRWRK